jgi:hypothetical protein
LQAKRKLTGIMNFTNPGAISHNEVWCGGLVERESVERGGSQLASTHPI